VLDKEFLQKIFLVSKLPKGRVLGGLIHISTLLSTRQAVKNGAKILKNSKKNSNFLCFT